MKNQRKLLHHDYDNNNEDGEGVLHAASDGGGGLGNEKQSEMIINRSLLLLQQDGSSRKKYSIEDHEEWARSLQITNPFVLALLGFYAACKVMVFYLINLESLVSCGMSAGLTVYWYNYGLYQIVELGNEWNGGGMNYVILAFAVTSPIAAAIGMAFTRRERALMEIADFQSFAHQLYMAHSLWDWDHSSDDDDNGTTTTTASTNNKNTGTTTPSPPPGRRRRLVDFHTDRSKLRLKHSDAVLTQLIGIGDEMARFLTLPTVSRSIHRMTKPGKQQAAETADVAYRLLHSMASHRLTRLAVYGERIKKAGLSTGEISRIRQYERFLEDNVKRLRMIKLYRTPQAFRSFARLFTIFLPPFYSPTYAQVAIDTHSLGLGVTFGVITAVALTALFESLQVLEDPFVATLQLDGIDCREEFQVLLWTSLVNTRRSIFPNAPPFPARRRKALDFDEGHEADTTPAASAVAGTTTEPNPEPTTTTTGSSRPPARGHSKKPSSVPSVTSFVSAMDVYNNDHHTHHGGAYARIFDVAGASQPNSLHPSYTEQQQQQSGGGGGEVTPAERKQSNDELNSPSDVGTVVITRTDSIEFGDPLDYDLDSLTVTNHGGNTGSNGGGGIQPARTGDNRVGEPSSAAQVSASASLSTSSAAVSSHHNNKRANTTPSPSRHRRQLTNRTTASSAIPSWGASTSTSTIGVRESNFERERKPHSQHHSRSRTWTSIPASVYNGG